MTLGAFCFGAEPLFGVVDVVSVVVDVVSVVDGVV